MSGIRVGHSAMTDRIYAGHLSKDGKTWLSDRQDVTSDALHAIIDYVGTGNILTVTDGENEFEIEVRAIAKATNAKETHPSDSGV